mmetsp:Transcript_41541/g.120299  ORF Transcript_41541/g.120299 Transcript_41541/m.120299 type:complete len:414 (+) Transcript_41541:76-1317(+)
MDYASVVAKLRRPADGCCKSTPCGASLASTRASSSTSFTSTYSFKDLALAIAVATRLRRDAQDKSSGAWALVEAVGHRLKLAAVAGLLVTLWMAWTKYMRRVARRQAKWGNGRVAMLAGAALFAGARRMGLTANNEVAEGAGHVQQMHGRQCLACWHPHGLYTIAPFLFHSQLPRNRDSVSYGYFTAVAGACFHLPVFREILGLINARVADSRIVDGLLTEGHSVFVCPGGIYEQLHTDPNQEQVFFPPNLGFVRQAIKHGVPLVPTYNFGENQLFDLPDWSRKLSLWLKERYNMGVPLGIGRHHLPFVPRKLHLSIRVGDFVEVGEAEEHPSDERVREVFLEYCRALRRLFEAHKDEDLPPEVAARGLILVWRGHDDVDLSLDALLGKRPALDPEPKMAAAPRGPPPPRSRL